MKKMNCWEIKECGREPGGSRSKELGVCPAASDTSCDGKNGGKKGGRLCWAIAGTLCRGISRGSNVHRQISCLICDVFVKVRAEERSNMTFLDISRLYHEEDTNDLSLCCEHKYEGKA